jgi:uncharacterized membrane protein
MKRIVKGMVLFLLPVVLVILIVEKAIMVIRALIQPLRGILPEDGIFGIGMITLVSVGLIILICYIAGRHAEKKNLKSILPFLEDNLLVFIPGYTLIKSSAGETLGDQDVEWKAVMIEDENAWKYGIEVDRSKGLSTIFFPEPPDAKSGELKVLPSTEVKKLNIPASTLIAIIRKYGHGASSLHEKYMAGLNQEEK